jgi:hypothetical protein
MIAGDHCARSEDALGPPLRWCCSFGGADGVDAVGASKRSKPVE